MHSLRRELVTRHPLLSGVLFWSAVIFPFVPFHEASGEWHEWQVIDSKRFSTRPISMLLEQVLDDASELVQRTPSSSWFYPEKGEPTTYQSSTIAEILRPKFEFFESPRSRSQRHEEELRFFTDEQLAALDAMEVNPRVVFYGPAGTGKTLLAIESARRSAEQGRKVLFLCYNRLLGKWLEEQTRDLYPSVVCRTLHSYMLSISGSSKVEQEDRFWEHALPLRAVDVLLEAEGEEFLFDELIVDEVQDLLRDEYLDVLDLSLKGGIGAGRWRLFGDFEKQAIYHSANISLEQFVQGRAVRAPVYALRANCRNTPRIAELVHLLGGLQPRYAKVLRLDDRVEPELIYYKTPSQQQQLLLSALEHLYASGYHGLDIVILSPRSGKADTAASVDKEPWKGRIKPIEAAAGVILVTVRYTLLKA